MLNTAIIGLGWWGRTLVGSVQGKSEDLRFVAGATGRRALAEDFAQEKGFRLHDDLAGVLADRDVEAVVLATPHLDHARQIVEVARSGRHVFVEKPFTLDKASAEEAVGAAQAAGVTLGLGHNRRFHPHMEALKARVHGGDLGTILHCEGTMTASRGLFMQADSWRRDPRQSPAGGLSGLGIHMIDGMISLLGPLGEVLCQSVHRAAPSGDEDTTSILLRFQNGVTGFVSCMTATAPLYRFCVYGSKGIAEITTPSLDDLTFTPTPDGLSGHGAATPIERSHVTGVDMVRLELEEFARAAKGQGTFRITPPEMVASAAAFEAVARSASDRQWVRLN